MSQQSFIYKFLLSPQYKTWRYIFLVVFFIIVSLNQVLVDYGDIIDQIGSKIYWVFISILLVYIITVYQVLRLISRYLLSHQYMQLMLCIILASLFYTVVTSIPYFFIKDDYNLFTEEALLDHLSAFVVYLLCMSGVIIPVFLRNWMVSNQHLNQLKIRQESSQVEQLKEQINPVSFFKVLSKSRSFVKTEPDKASAMLMKLSQLLRYQLYDCNREQVLLTAEISFLRNFLELEKLHSSRFDYSIEADGNINGIFVFPSVLLPYVQGVINSFDNENESHIVGVEINSAEEAISVELKITGVNSNVLLKSEMSKVCERLDALYKDCYELIIADGNSPEITNLSLRLYKK